MKELLKQILQQVTVPTLDRQIAKSNILFKSLDVCYRCVHCSLPCSLPSGLKGNTNKQKILKIARIDSFVLFFLYLRRK